MKIDSAQLAAFLAVIREQSFDAAARALFVTPSAISQRIKQFEERAGTLLIERATPCKPTQAGERLLRYALQMELLESEALADLSGDSGTAFAREQSAPAPQRVAIAVNADSLATWLAPALARVQEKYSIAFELHVEDQDHSTALLKSGRVMAAITTEARAAQGCVATALGAMRYLAVASPAFYGKHFARGVNARTLAAAPCNVFNRKDSLQDDFLKRLGVTDVSPPAHYIPSTHGFVEAALAGLGWGMNPRSLVAAELTSGRLRELKRGAALDVPLYWQRWGLRSALLDSITAAMVSAAKDELILKPQFLRSAPTRRALKRREATKTSR